MNYSPELLAAVAVLDNDQPGWWRKVDLARFNLGWSTDCVVGQSYDCPDFFSLRTQCTRLFAATEIPFIADQLPAILCDATETNGNTERWVALISERQEADNFTHDTLEEERVEMIEGVPC